MRTTGAAARVFTLLAATLLFAGAAQAQESMSERELKRIVQRDRMLRNTLNENSGSADRANIQLQLQEVVQDYERIIKTDPKFTPAYVAYGLLLNRLGEHRRSAEILLIANKLDPNLAIVKNQLGNYSAEEGEFQDALEYYLAAITLEPGEALYYYQLGTLLREYHDHFVLAGRFDSKTGRRQTVEAFKRAAEIEPDTLPYGYAYAKSLYDLDEPDWPAALTTWEELRNRVRPGIARQMIDLQRANILIIQERFAEARALIEGVTDLTLAQSKETLIARLPETP